MPSPPGPAFHEYTPVWDRGYFTITEQNELMPLYPRFAREVSKAFVQDLKLHPPISEFLNEVVMFILVSFPHRRRLTRNMPMYETLLRNELYAWFSEVHDWFGFHVHQNGCNGCASSGDLFALTDGVVDDD